MELQENHLKLMRKSWDYAAKDLPRCTKQLIQFLYELDPSLEVYFKRHEDHIFRVMMIIDALFSQYTTAKDMEDRIQELGMKHGSLGISKDDYDTLAIALLMTMEKMLGRKWTREVREAWAISYSTLANKMLKAGKEQLKFYKQSASIR